VQLFPVSRVAQEEARLRQKLAGYVKSYGAGARLNQRDTAALEAIEATPFGTAMGTPRARAIVRTEETNDARQRGNWRHVHLVTVAAV
jgi:hypothetical protein